MSETAITGTPAEVKILVRSDASTATCSPPIKKAPFFRRDLGWAPLLIGMPILLGGGYLSVSALWAWNNNNAGYQQINLQPSPRTIYSFQAEKFEGIHDPRTFQILDWVVITYAGKGVTLREGPLSNCNVALTVYYDNGEVKEVKRFFGVWQIEEKKSVDLPSHGRSIQRIDFQGSAEEDYSPVSLSGYGFLWGK